MVATRISRDTPEERIVFWAIAGTWGLWLLGALYDVYSVLGWLLVAMVVARRIGLIDDHGHPVPRTPWGTMPWVGGMATMLLALIIAHVEWDLDAEQFLKSLFGWAKGWGLMAAYIYAGANLRIKPLVVFRAVNILAAQSLAMTVVLSLLTLAGAPEVLYVSPLQYLGGPGPMFFSVNTHSWDPGAVGFRLFYFAPWAPAAAFCAHIGLVSGMYDTQRRWRLVGIVSAFVVCAASQSRLSLVAVPLLLVGVPVLSRLLAAWPSAIAAAATTSALLLLTQVSDAIDDVTQAFVGARADSSRVRATLSRMAYHRWETEALWFGHGAVERGSHLVEYMPIGSHHTWYGLLFVKGGVGFAALAIPLAWSFFEFLAKAQRDPVARGALGMVLVLVFNSFGENLEILAYLAWPGLIIIGIAARRRLLVPEIWEMHLRPALAVRAEAA